MPLVMKRQVNGEKSQIFPNAKPTGFLLGKLGGYLQLRNFTFWHYKISIW